MDIRITARRVELTAAARRRLTLQLERLRRFAPELTGAVVKLAAERYGVRAELLVRVRHKDRVAVGTAADPALALEGAVERLEKQLVRLKDRGARSAVRTRADEPLRRSATRLALDGPKGRKRAPRLAEPAAAAPRPAAVAPAAAVVRQRMPAGKPLSVDEAAERLAQEGQSFLVFVDSRTERPCVLYRRPDGRLALVEARA